jgi:CheY-like chemotaxis protein
MGTRVLIVDDEAAVRTLLRCAVAELGFTVVEADSGKRALEIAAGEAPFELVVTDILMPGMDGFELANELSRGGYTGAFLFVSGYCDSDSITDRLEKFEAAAFLSKPFPIPELVQTVRRLLRWPQSAGGAALKRPA